MRKSWLWPLPPASRRSLTIGEGVALLLLEIGAGKAGDENRQEGDQEAMCSSEWYQDLLNSRTHGRIAARREPCDLWQSPGYGHCAVVNTPNAGARPLQVRGRAFVWLITMRMGTAGETRISQHYRWREPRQLT